MKKKNFKYYLLVLQNMPEDYQNFHVSPTENMKVLKYFKSLYHLHLEK